jgi:hypothetical protein
MKKSGKRRGKRRFFFHEEGSLRNQANIGRPGKTGFGTSDNIRILFSVCL